MQQNDQTLTIREVQTVRYRLPGHDRLGNSITEVNAIVVIDGIRGSNERARGVGEAQFRGDETGDRQAASWEFLTEVISELEGRSLDLSSYASALVSIAEVMSAVAARTEERREKVLPVWYSNDGGAAQRRLAHPFAGTLFGIETALLDLAAHAMAVSVATLLTQGQKTTSQRIPVMPLHLIVANQRVQIQEQVQRIAAVQPAGTPVWMDFGRRTSYEIASKWITRFYNLIDREIADEIVMYRPLLREEEARYPDLARSARDAFVGAGRGVGKVAIATDPLSLFEGAPDTAETSYTILRAGAFSSLVEARDVTQRFAEEGKTVYILANGNTGPVAQAALIQLAAASQNVRGIVAVQPVGVDGRISGPGLGIEAPWEMLLTADGVRFASTVKDTPSQGLEFNTYPELPYLQTLGPNGTKGHLMEREALALGMNTIRYSKGAFTASDGVHDPLVFKWSRSPLSSAVSLSLCTHKEATRMRLGQAGIPVPRGRTFRNGDFDTAREFADMIGYPVVVKPAMGVRGIGVVAGITDRKELDLAFEQLSDSKLGSQDFIVEKHVHGKDYRIVVVGDRVIAAILREPASVRGDGVHTVAELILRKNAQRRLNPHLWGRPIVYDAAAEYQLERLALTPESIPEIDQLVMLSNSSSLSQGGDSFDVRDELHPSIVEACIATVKAIPDLAFCGVDFLLEDHTKPLSEQEAGICELNAHAAIGNCEYPLYGKPRKVAEAFMDLCVERYGLKVREQRADQVSVTIRVRGRVTGVGYRAWISRLANEYGINGWVRNVDQRTVEAVLSGETMAVTALVAAAVLGPARAKPTSVTTRHIEDPKIDGFSIETERPKEFTLVR